ncbi:LysR family transcriptional regulator [Epibacterium sp. Ofav1-8]|uniref:LysR family transcriptional regulator n=1 Tax=Epibacterium sp. Ofav1-8 TaxID=2917735 RepID=UPI001EF48295|nr:LysR family transcriptional regulator [Epibacterium sp. Ofav1-8]MCG7625429.1 LysR family transcriptional regulator [Epibacterium sp. Ofav1-8]
MLKIETLRAYVTVARSGNLSDAAEVLGRTPSALSMMLKQLEAHLGEPLFETDRKNRLTALGAFVLEQAEQEVQHFDTTVRAIEGYARAVYGRVRIATVPSVAGTIIPQVFSRYINDFGEVDIEVRDMDSNSIRHELSRNRIDIGIATKGEHDAGLHSELLLSDEFGVICAPDHPLARQAGPVSWAELAGHRLIANSLSAGIEAAAARDLHAQALLTAQNLTSIFGMLRANIGITLLPEMATSAAAAGELVFRPLADVTARREIHLLRKADSTLSPAARLLEERIKETVANLQVGSEAVLAAARLSDASRKMP